MFLHIDTLTETGAHETARHRNSSIASSAGAPLSVWHDLILQVQEQIKAFTDHLEKFAVKHRDAINRDPEFRKQFNDMCKTIGVDPLKCKFHTRHFLTLTASKGFWADVLGVGDFYYELGIQIIEICMMTREVNGGLIEMEALVSMLRQKRGDEAGLISQYANFFEAYFSLTSFRFDVERAVQKLFILGNGFALVKIGSKLMVQSVPMELSSDHTTLLTLAQVKNPDLFVNSSASRLRDSSYDPRKT